MSNVPPPDPNSSKLGMDEWIGIIVTFTVIGAILIPIINNKEKSFNLKQWGSASNSETKTQIKQLPTAETPTVTETPIVTATPIVTDTPTVTDTPSLKVTEIPSTKSPAPASLLPVAPKLPEATVNNTSNALRLNQPPSVATLETPTPQPTVTPTKTVKFTDVDDNLWARPYIDELVKRDIVNGFNDGTFRPNESINRAEFSALLKKAFNQKQTLEIPSFKDIKQDYWGLPVIHETAKNGFLRGYPDKTFRPTQPISRVQVLVALTSGLGLKNSNNSDQVLKKYQDGEQVPKYAIEKVSAATEAGIVVNYPNSKSLKPNQNATRAEVAALVYQALVKEGKAEAIPSEYVVKP
ncbi:S-layer homology domain-containing protein [Limnofasciculus baicalensis]|uniref:S-layer homology domain-containing protein n=1 Tax=Limnofasciculus baicalensis BBK-W-15 TaxID=2699891 RepID=A0AAE3KNB3_9CYAN|nr:S-layer homology domain-containing protein [Limnofasciculus baicalensis]MCP2730169.1 S-layer homology domain-containing protein [Limnofasciculus baicalensis BBK-W-15]